MRRHRRCVRKALILRLAEARRRKRRREDLVRCRPLPHHCIRRAVSDCARVCFCAATVIEGSGCGMTDMAVAKTNSVDTAPAAPLGDLDALLGDPGAVEQPGHSPAHPIHQRLSDAGGACAGYVARTVAPPLFEPSFQPRHCKRRERICSENPAHPRQKLRHDADQSVMFCFVLLGLLVPKLEHAHHRDHDHEDRGLLQRRGT